jgi:hypothetical protein
MIKSVFLLPYNLHCKITIFGPHIDDGGYISVIIHASPWEKFEDTRHYNGQKKKDKQSSTKQYTEN